MGCRGGCVSAHLRKVCEKRGKHAHLRKVESARCVGQRGYNMLPGRWRFSPPSEGVWKTWETAHLRKVESARCIGKQGYNMLPGRWRFCPPSEGVWKTWETCSPSEGGIGTMCRPMWLQYAPGAVAFQPTFGRCVKNAENMLTFGRWNRHDVSANRATICSRGGGVSAHLRKVCGKRGKLLTFRRWK